MEVDKVDQNTCFSRLSCSVSIAVGGVSSRDGIGLTSELQGYIHVHRWPGECSLLDYPYSKITSSSVKSITS